jgi:hypothetical protein
LLNFLLPKIDLVSLSTKASATTPNYGGYNRDAKKYKKDCKYTTSRAYIAYFAIANCKKSNNGHITKDSGKDHYENDEDRKK